MKITNICTRCVFSSFLAITLCLSYGTGLADSDGLKVKNAKYKLEDDRLKIKGKARDNAVIDLFNAESGVQFATVSANSKGKWKHRVNNPDAIPCRVRAESGGKSDSKKIRHANDFPGGCGIDGGVAINSSSQDSSSGTQVKDAKYKLEDDRLKIKGKARDNSVIDLFDAESGVQFATITASDKGDWEHRENNPDAIPCRVRAESSGTSDSKDVEHANDFPGGCGIDGGGTPPPGGGTPPPGSGEVSINSTSQNGIPGAPVSEQPFIGLAGYQIFAANDLGMHCGDFDTRISSILPPFNVMHSQVVMRSSDPVILTPADGVDVIYSASSNPTDPILSGMNSAGSGPVLSSVTSDGTVYKTNFWDIARVAYDPFYPQGILPAFYPDGLNILDLGLPMPNVEQLFLGDGNLSAEQQEAPGRFGPYMNNDPLAFKLFTTDQAFFLLFPFGYTSEGVNWFEAAGVPLTAFDDFGRENPWQLMRVQAMSGGQVLASLDTVLPISGEANCGFCHGDMDDGGNGAATQALFDAGIPVATAMEDPLFDNGMRLNSVPIEVSKEYAADLNLIRLHDLKHGTDLENSTPVVCQSCHYTPALDLAQLGPQGAENDMPLVLNGVEVSPSIANGRDQIKNQSMSSVMHGHHATVTGLDGKPLFPAMPPPVDSNGNLRDPAVGKQVMEDTCYQCHPGRRTDCLRGAMASGGMLCQDCHGDMAQIGNDFSKFVSPTNPGDFRLAGDFYTNPDTLRVPWANEPSCGSCHTGDVMDNLHGTPGTIGDPQDGIRLMQAYKTTDDKATPIVPTNKRFAENVVATGDAAGNPMLFRVSKGHEGVFCEACHGSTHGIWPNKNPAANDNVAAKQLQGHTGVIAECSTCHTGDLGINLDGPHGMHPVGTAGNDFADGGHEDLAERNPDACRACHGRNGEGTVLSAMAQDRVLQCDERTAFCPDGNSVLFPNDHQVGCTECHDNEL